MRVSLNCLKQYVDINIPTNDFLDKMVMLGLEIEECVDLSEKMKNVVVGRVEKMERHPDSDHLWICQVNVGKETIQIVTGAQNVFEGALVPVALHDSLLPNGTKIKRGKLRGVESNGMLCSGEELTVDDSVYPGAEVNGILILTNGEAIGTDMRSVIGFDDVIVDFKATANRPDCLSLNGIAREAAVALGQKVTYPSSEYTTAGGSIENMLSVEVKAPDLCRRYMARAVRNVRIAPSPEWVKKTLNASGIRAINNIVDITNLVMLEFGQPMHAFDYRDIGGAHICVRRAEEGEKLTTLDGKEHVLNTETLVIADSERAIGLAGIMGGENSEIKDDTTTVVFESANFKRDNIRRTARALGIRTESSARFERGIDIQTAQMALDRAVALVCQLGAGEVVNDTINVQASPYEERVVTVDSRRVNALLGLDVPIRTMLSILNGLEIKTTEQDGVLTCRIPHYRDDIEGTADIAEEILRVYGYDNIHPTEMKAVLKPGMKTPGVLLKENASAALASLGFNEAVTYSFIPKKAFDLLCLEEDSDLRRAVEIMNPLGEDYSVMRTTMAHNMLTVLALNINRKNPSGRFFAVENVYLPKQLPPTEQPLEKPIACLGAYGEGEDFFTMKGAIEDFALKMGIHAQLKFEAGGRPYLHDGRRAVISVNKMKIGLIGEVHPDVAANYQITGRAYLAELDLEAAAAAADHAFAVKPLPKYPAVKRDIAVTVDKEVPVGELIDQIRAGGKEILERCELFDVYEGAQVLIGKKSVAFALTFRASDRTLTDDEVAAAFDRIVRALDRNCGAKLR